MAENFQNMVKNINLQIQVAQYTPNRRNSKKSMLRNIIIKLLKIKTKKFFESNQSK